MQYNMDHARTAAKFAEQGMKPSTIVALINKQYETKYAVADINSMIEDIKNNPPPSENGRLFDVAAGIVFNPRKRKKIKIVVLSIVFTLITALILLGVFVSWKPVAIIAGSIIGFVALVVITIIVLVKTGVLEKLLEKYD